MKDFIADFAHYMSKYGLEPANISDIIADNKRRNYQLSTDPKKKKRGYYKLDIDGDFAYGFFGDYRSDECYSWNAYEEKDITPEQRKEYKRMAAERKKKHDAERKKQQKEAANQAQEEAIFCVNAKEDHPYLVRKKMKAHDLKQDEDDNLIVLMQDETGFIWNRQSITPRGSKYFIENGRVNGAFFVIKGSTDTIYIAEGLATGASVHEATGAIVYVAFNAGNLKHVAKTVRKMFPDGVIVIAGDNDYETKIRGKLYNTGVIKGTDAASSIDAKFIAPVFKKGDNGLSDFNDIHTKYGLDALKEMLEGLLSGSSNYGGGVANSLVPNKDAFTHNATPSPPSDEVDNSWKCQLIKDSKGRIDTKSTTNATLCAFHDENLKGVYRYNGFSKETIVSKCPPWENERLFKVRPIQDHDYLPLECYLETVWDMKTTKSKCADIINLIARDEDNAFNPASEYFNNLEWDRVPRIDGWLWDYVADQNQDERYIRMIGRKFLCGMAGRAIKPGIKFDTMLIFEGRQYAGKSRLCRALSTINGEEYFLDDFRDIDNKDALMKMQGKLVVEFPEISTLRRSEVNDLKGFLSREEDVYREPYGRNVLTSPRQCVFIGTVNPEGEYFRDLTGNRRYWPMKCRDSLRVDELVEHIPQLHAEAAFLFKNGEQLWLTEEEYEIAKVEQDKRTMSDPWSDKIASHIECLKTVSTMDICELLNIPMERRSSYTYSRIAQIFTHLGWESSRVRDGGKQVRGYRKIGSVEQIPFAEEVQW